MNPSELPDFLKFPNLSTISKIQLPPELKAEIEGFNDYEREIWHDFFTLWLELRAAPGKLPLQIESLIFNITNVMSLFIENESNFNQFLLGPLETPPSSFFTKFLSFIVSLLLISFPYLLKINTERFFRLDGDPIIILKLFDYFPLGQRIQLIPLWTSLIAQSLQFERLNYFLFEEYMASIKFYCDIPVSSFESHIQLLIDAVKGRPYHIPSFSVFHLIIFRLCESEKALWIVLFLREILSERISSFDEFTFDSVAECPSEDDSILLAYLEYSYLFFYHFDLFNTPENNIFDFLGENTRNSRYLDFSLANDKIYEIIFPLALDHPDLIPFLPYFSDPDVSLSNFYLSRKERKFFTQILSLETRTRFFAYIVHFSGYLEHFPDRAPLFTEILKTLPPEIHTALKSGCFFEVLPSVQDDMARIMPLLTDIYIPPKQHWLILRDLSSPTQWFPLLIPRIVHYLWEQNPWIYDPEDRILEYYDPFEGMFHVIQFFNLNLPEILVPLAFILATHHYFDHDTFFDTCYKIFRHLLDFTIKSNHESCSFSSSKWGPTYYQSALEATAKKILQVYRKELDTDQGWRYYLPDLNTLRDIYFEFFLVSSEALALSEYCFFTEDMWSEAGKDVDIRFRYGWDFFTQDRHIIRLKLFDTHPTFISELLERLPHLESLSVEGEEISLNK